MVDVNELMQYERQLQEQGYKYICGVDEVGRGPLAGPVTCTAVIMPLDDLIQGVNDSKKVSKNKRIKLYDIIVEKAIAVNTVSYDNKKIDEMNILEATKACMRDAIMGLSVEPDIVLVDALKLDIPYKTMGIIKGDALSYSIASASIVAKVTRDRFMEEMAEKYPEYGFANNAGYGTAQHISALKEIGATPIHRKTFIKNFV
ncbi:MAG: ribonuclease HII [Clostridia bacterium]|nr:ribonuclease HII [Clostridia bacterium]MBO7152089.1 ribonuclease HII [Clostridia bacterium]